MAAAGATWHTTKSGKKVVIRSGESLQKALARNKKK